MRALAASAFSAALLAASLAEAHAMPNSTVVIRPVAAGIDAAVSIPLSELQAAIGGPVTVEGDGRAALEAYIRDHVAVTGADARPWSLRITRLELAGGEHPASLEFAPAPDAAPRAASLRYDAVNHRIASHYVLVWRRDAGPGGALIPLGRLQFPVAVLPLGLAVH
jgi:hypothetical protein